MLGDNELADTGAQLAAFNSANAKHQDTLREVLEKYGTLVDDYKRLKSDYEEERDAREKYKQLARGQERNPFVLVLVDGDGYIFNDELVSGGTEGGQRAAHLLNDYVKASLRGKNLDNCRIMVRVYSNLVGLSKVLSKQKLCGAEKRSLAPFVAHFNRTFDLFDYVDAGELKENADSKLRGMFRQFVDNTQCRHIYFAGCHDVGYINELTPYRNHRDKITLVDQYNLHPEFRKLGMNIESLGHVFRQAPLDGPSFAAQMPYRPQNLEPGVPNSAAAEQGQKICVHYQKGKCAYGNKCTKLHIKPSTMNDTSAAGTPNWRAGNGHKASDSVSVSGRTDDNRDMQQVEQRFDGFSPMPSAGQGSPPPPQNTTFPQQKPFERKICKFYAKGQCTFGNNCNNLHIRTNDAMQQRQENFQPTNNFGSTAPGARDDSSAFGSSADNDFMRTSAQSTASNTDPATLPPASSVPQNKIPVNPSNYRLDPLIPEPSLEDRNEYQARVAQQKLCNRHHLSRECHDSQCPYDHNFISEGMKECLKAAAKNTACFERGKCRNLACTMGHVCTKPDCKYRNGNMWCKIPGPLHIVDLTVAGYVDGYYKRANGSAANGSNAEEGSAMGSPELSVKSPGGMFAQEHWSRALSGFNRASEGAGGSGKTLERAYTQGSDQEEGGADMGNELHLAVDDLD